MTKKKVSKKNNKVEETIELDDAQASQVKGGMWQQAIFTNDTISRGPATGTPKIKK